MFMPVVMVIEDSQDARALYRKGLEEEGYEVIEAGSGEEALGLLGSKSKPDLVLLDLTLPGMSGAEFHERLRSMPDFQEQRTLIISGKEDLRSIAKSLGATGHLRKPFDLFKFFSEVARCLPE